ncbi:hypothetical protein L3X38_015285 [Prunus dulcis]|uniref:Uncharacterized protein n=1 Tax=Prunus dulcis TaxID=3755 RepID=A0AAD4ZJ41_PRUDU|nr:hypothetical protein L3X38_015285 [Prunus dulcis]
MLLSSQVEENRTAGSLAVIPIHFVPGSSTKASFANPELAEFEAMDLDAQLDRLEKLGATPSKAKSKAVDEAVERIRIWQSTELDLDENKRAVDQLMKDLDLLHSENMAPRPILEHNLHRTSLTYSIASPPTMLFIYYKRMRQCWITHPGIALAPNSLNFGVPTTPKPVSSQKASC